MSSPIPKVSVIIPTYNAEATIKELIRSILEQNLKPYEIIVIDSSSEDNTLKIAGQLPVKIIKIKKIDFNHGKTRNMGAKMAKGEIIVFLTQDALPSNKVWLRQLAAGLNSSIVASFSRQKAKAGAPLLEKYFYEYMYPNKNLLLSKSNYRHEGCTVFSNASSAIKRDTLIANPFREDILMSEDLEWALRTLNSDHEISYRSKSIVNHSHSTSLIYLVKRYYDFGVSHSDIISKGLDLYYLNQGIKYTLKELKYLVVNRKYTDIAKFFTNNLAKYIGWSMGRARGRIRYMLPTYIKRTNPLDLSEY